MQTHEATQQPPTDGVNRPKRVTRWLVTVAVLATVITGLGARRLLIANQDSGPDRALLEALHRVATDYSNIQYAERGFAIAGSSGYRINFRDAIHSGATDIDQVVELSHKVGTLQGEARDLQQSFQQRCAEMTLAVDAREKHGKTMAMRMIASPHQRELQGDLGEQISNMLDIETQSLSLIRERERWSVLMTGFGLFGLLATAISSARTFIRKG